MLSCTHEEHGLATWHSINIKCKCVNYLVSMRLLYSWLSGMSKCCFVYRTWIKICFLRSRWKLKKWRGADRLNNTPWCGIWRFASSPLSCIFLSNITVLLLWVGHWEDKETSLPLLMSFLWPWRLTQTEDLKHAQIIWDIRRRWDWIHWWGRRKKEFFQEDIWSGIYQLTMPDSGDTRINEIQSLPPRDSLWGSLSRSMVMPYSGPYITFSQIVYS